MTLETRSIGRTDRRVTKLGFGGAPLGAVGARIDNAEAAAVVDAAWQSGIRYFDTAPLYGHGLSEKRLGAALSAHDRSDFVLSSKVGRLLVPVGEGERNPAMNDDEPFAVRYDYSRDGVARSVEASLERLGLDRIDLLLCHDIDAWTHGDDQPAVYEAAVGGALPAMVELRDQGIVGAVGLGVNEWQVCSQVMDEIDLDCFLLAGRFTLLEQHALDEFLPRCVEQDISVIVGGPYNSGLLATTDRRRATYDYKPVPDDLWDRTTRIRQLCADHEVDIRAAALQYPLRHPAVAAVIPGMWSLDEVEANRRLVDVELPGQLWADLASAGLARLW
ncbi:MAG: aldo/keto reductase [Acidimicrobiales bacterium]